MKTKIKSLLNKKNKNKIVCLTSYSKTTSKILDKYCDLILVGDSLANVLYGMKTTHNLKLETMINHAKSVTLGAKKSLVVVDMPKDSYKNPKQALKNAKHIMKETGCDGIMVGRGAMKNPWSLLEIANAFQQRLPPVITSEDKKLVYFQF